jgi:hypothetical protein
MGSMFMKELRDAKDYVERAKSIFLDAVSEPDRDNAMILIGLGRTFLQVAEEIERKFDANLRNSGASGLLHELGYGPGDAAVDPASQPDLVTVCRRRQACR